MCPPIPRTRKETPWPSLFPPAPTPQAPLPLAEGLPTPLLPSWKVTTPAPMCSLISRSVSCVTDLLSVLSRVLPSSPGSLGHLGPGLPPPLLVPRSHTSPLRSLAFPAPSLQGRGLRSWQSRSGGLAMHSPGFKSQIHPPIPGAEP